MVPEEMSFEWSSARATFLFLSNIFFSFRRARGLEGVSVRRRGRSPLAWRWPPTECRSSGSSPKLMPGFNIPVNMDIFGFAAKRQAPAFSFLAPRSRRAASDPIVGVLSPADTDFDADRRRPPRSRLFYRFEATLAGPIATSSRTRDCRTFLNPLAKGFCVNAYF